MLLLVSSYDGVTFHKRRVHEVRVRFGKGEATSVSLVEGMMNVMMKVLFRHQGLLIFGRVLVRLFGYEGAFGRGRVFVKVRGGSEALLLFLLQTPLLLRFHSRKKVLVQRGRWHFGFFIVGLGLQSIVGEFINSWDGFKVLLESILSNLERSL